MYGVYAEVADREFAVPDGRHKRRAASATSTTSVPAVPSPLPPRPARPAHSPRQTPQRLNHPCDIITQDTLVPTTYSNIVLSYLMNQIHGVLLRASKTVILHAIKLKKTRSSTIDAVNELRMKLT